jgi:hypothetical protein
MKYLKVFEEYSNEIFKLITRQEFSLVVTDLIFDEKIQFFDSNDKFIIEEIFNKKHISIISNDSSDKEIKYHIEISNNTIHLSKIIAIYKATDSYFYVEDDNVYEKYDKLGHRIASSTGYNYYKCDERDGLKECLELITDLSKFKMPREYNTVMEANKEKFLSTDTDLIKTLYYMPFGMNVIANNNYKNYTNFSNNDKAFINNIINEFKINEQRHFRLLFPNVTKEISCCNIEFTPSIFNRCIITIYKDIDNYFFVKWELTIAGAEPTRYFECDERDGLRELLQSIFNDSRLKKDNYLMEKYSEPLFNLISASYAVECIVNFIDISDKLESISNLFKRSGFDFYRDFNINFRPMIENPNFPGSMYSSIQISFYYERLPYYFYFYRDNDEYYYISFNRGVKHCWYLCDTFEGFETCLKSLFKEFI